MIERIKGTDEFSPSICMQKLNELIDASNRQDRAISFMLNEQYLSDIHKALPEDTDYWMRLRNV